MIIPDWDTLSRYIPNALEPSARDTRSLFDRISPHIHAAETWIGTHLTPLTLITEDTDPDTLALLRTVTAWKAWKAALPMLDILITHSGTGVTETQSVKPASKAKIDRLLRTLDEETDTAIGTLLPRLRDIPGWTESIPGRTLCASILRTYADIKPLATAPPYHDTLLRLLPAIAHAQDHIARMWISGPVMKRILAIDQRDTEATETPLIREVKAAVIEYIATASERTSHAQAAAAIVTENPAIYPEFIGTDTHRLFLTPPFRNRRDAPGHWL